LLRHLPLFLLLLWLVGGNTAWYILGDHPQHWDSAIHLSESLNANRIEPDHYTSVLHQALNVSWYYPPFVSYVSALLYGVLGESEFAGLQVMTLFYLILVLSVYATGKMLFGDWEGLIAAWLIASCPIVIRYSHMFMLDLPLASMVALSLYLLIRTDSFKQRMASLAFGLALGAGMLTKWTFPLFILVPFLFTSIPALRRSAWRRWQVTSCILSLLVGSVIAAPWYLVHAIQIVINRGGELGRGGATLAGSIGYYFRTIPEEVSWIILPLLVGGVLICLAKYRFRPQTVLMVLSFLGGYALLTLVTFKQPRFSIPLLAPLCVLASAGLVSWVRGDASSPETKRMLTAALIAVPLMQYLFVSFIPLETPLGKRLSRPFHSASMTKVDGPVRADWKQDSIVAATERDRTGKRRGRVVLRVIPDHVYFNNATISYAAKLRRYPITVTGTSGFPLFTDYVLLKSGNTGDDSGDRDRLRNEILSEASVPDGMYDILERWELPDGSEGILLRVEPKPAVGISSRIVEEKLLLHADQFIRRYLKPLEGYNLQVEAIDSSETQRGHVKGIEVFARTAEFGDFAFNPVGLPVENVGLELTDLRFDPGKLVTADTLLLVSVGGLNVRSFTISAPALRHYAEATSDGGVTIDSFSIRGGVIHFEGYSRGFGPRTDVGIALHSIGHENIGFSIEHLRIGVVPVPALLMNVLTSSFNPVLTGLDALSEVTIGSLSLEDDRIKIGQ
jgi:dolichyl-phosphate-mannose-protein mannosyltransferase